MSKLKALQTLLEICKLDQPSEFQKSDCFSQLQQNMDLHLINLTSYLDQDMNYKDTATKDFNAVVFLSSGNCISEFVCLYIIVEILAKNNIEKIVFCDYQYSNEEVVTKTKTILTKIINTSMQGILSEESKLNKLIKEATFATDNLSVSKISNEYKAYFIGLHYQTLLWYPNISPETVLKVKETAFRGLQALYTQMETYDKVQHLCTQTENKSLKITSLKAIIAMELEHYKSLKSNGIHGGSFDNCSEFVLTFLSLIVIAFALLFSRQFNTSYTSNLFAVNKTRRKNKQITHCYG
jgi:hypothetical protein